MGQKFKKCRPDLAIQLVGGREKFRPGDTITGSVDRTAHIITPRALITIKLYGRSKARINPNTYDRDDAYDFDTSEFKLFDADDTEQVIFDGPLHIEQSSGGGTGEAAAWPFAIDIPLCTDPAALRKSGSQDESFESLDAAGRVLPDTFGFVDSAAAAAVDALIEYWLEATLTAHSANGKSSSYTSIMPVMLSTPHPGPPISDFDVQQQKCYKRDRFRSHRLVPGCEHLPLSSTQKMQRLLHSRKVPYLSVEYEVETPAVIQLNNPTPIPFFLRAVPKWASTSENLKAVRQKIRIDSVKVHITSFTEAKASGFITQENQAADIQVPLCEWTPAEDQEAHIPFLPDDPPLNIGELVNVLVGWGGRDKSKPGPGVRLFPTFTAYNMAHKNHVLKWTVRLSIAEETTELHIVKGVTILPASEQGWAVAGDEPPPPFVARAESWAKPPPEKGAPPAYCPPGKIQEGEGSGGSSAQAARK